MSVATLVKAIALATDLLTLANELTAAHAELSRMIDRAKAEGRDQLSDAEWAQIVALDDAARKRLDDAIARATTGSAAQVSRK